jgi:hypothetical protein
VDVEISTNGYDAAHDCLDGNCVVAQVEKDERIPANGRLAKAVRAEAWRFRVHFVGDLHQPLIGLLFWLAGLACRYVLAGTLPGTTFWTKLR